jgi:2-polyprenyl-3-methyl-5-hydroxy-6-metoxy-1,4-benzoquinol methylase
MDYKYQRIRQKDYESISGNDWPTFDDFVQRKNIPDYIYKELEAFFVQENPTSDGIVQNYEQYLKFIQTTYFTVCENQRVLEIGANTGHHTKLLISTNPGYLEVIEPDKICIKTLKKINGISNIVNDDALLILNKPRKFDVVVCFGVLYHLHSPLHLIELIVNNCNPDYIILDSTNDASHLEFQLEQHNVPGNRHVRPGWKCAGYKLVSISYDIVCNSLRNMNYNLVQMNKLSTTDHFSKSNSWVGCWKKLTNK